MPWTWNNDTGGEIIILVNNLCSSNFCWCSSNGSRRTNLHYNVCYEISSHILNFNLVFVDVDNIFWRPPHLLAMTGRFVLSFINTIKMIHCLTDFIQSSFIYTYNLSFKGNWRLSAKTRTWIWCYDWTSKKMRLVGYSLA